MHSAQQPPLRTVLNHLLIPVLMGAVMALAYLGGFHKPDPHHVPVAVVGTPATAGPVAAALQQAAGEALEVTTVPDRASAEAALKELRISGAYVPGAKHATLLVAPAASETTDSVVQKVFRAAAAQAGVDLRVEDVVALSPDDPGGQNGFFFLVVISVGSYASAIAIGAAAARRRYRDRVLLGAGTAVALASLYLAIAAGLFGMFAGHVWAVWALSTLTSAAILFIGIGLHPIIGRYCTLAFSTLFVALNFTSSGGVFAASMQPGFFGWLHEFWLGAGYIDALRVVIYFPDVPLARALWILFGWLAAGVLCLLAGWAAERSRARTAARVHREIAAGVASATRAERDERVKPVDQRSARQDTTELELELEENVAV